MSIIVTKVDFMDCRIWVIWGTLGIRPPSMVVLTALDPKRMGDCEPKNNP